MANEKMSKSERLEEGHVQVQAIIEIVGKPKEHVEQTLRDYVKKIKEDKSYEITEEFIDEAIEKDGLFTTYTDITLWAKSVGKLVEFCFDYMPSSIEIIEPEKRIMEMKVITDMLNDMQARLHHTDMLARNMFEENKNFNETLNRLMRNIIMISLAQKPLKIDALSKITGVDEGNLVKFLDKMVEEKKISNEAGTYSVPR